MTTSGVVFDPFSEDFFTDPYPVYQWMREHAPVYYSEQHDFYALTRHEDVAAALRVQDHVRSGDADQDHGAGQIAGIKCLLPGFGASDDVGAVAVGQILNGFHDIEFRGVDGVGGAEVAGPEQFLVVGVDGDDVRGPDQGGAGDGGVPDTAAADHRA